MTLYQLVMQPLLKEQNKHELGEGWAENFVNAMSNVELLQDISDALERAGVELK